MNFFTYLKQVAILTLCIPVFSIPLKSQCGQPDGTIIVNSANDTGIGTLRDAINCANIFQGPNRIIFDIPTTDRAIILVGSTSGQALPSLINPATIIDATTQSGYGINGNFEPKIVLDGSIPSWTAPINALEIFGNETEIYGLEIRNFPDDGIDVNGADNVIIGDEEKGNVIYNCGIEQDFFPETGNIGPFNGVGIVTSADADNIEIINNIIGTDYNQNPNLGNEWAGIYTRSGSDFALIENNIITGNEIGVRIRNAFGIRITENKMSCNTLTGIQLIDGGNDDKAAPIITAASNTQITGTGSISNEIEVYISEGCANSPCQGTVFIGRTIVQNNGTWTLNAPFNRDLTNNENVTAIALDNNDRTSTFSDCMTAVVQTNNCADANGVILVTTANDAGDGSLRAAIECANATPGPNTIQFNINGGGRQQINVGSTTNTELPFLRDGGTIIDATTQPGYGASGIFRPLIVLDGSGYDWRFPHNALWVRADNCEIYGLEIRNFPDDGIDITGGDFNIIGAPNKGNILYNCGAEKDIFEDDPAQRTWNGCAIVMKSGAQNTIVQGNIIGTNFEQTETIGNELCGVIIERNGNSNNLIGGTAEGEGNIFAYHPIGITVFGGSINNQILGNSFYCNENNGIELSADANNQQTAPVINTASVSVINGTGDNGATVEVYTTSSNCQTGPCQGNTLIGRTTIVNNIWRLEAPFLNGITLQGGEQITSLATSATGNTSAFGDCINVEGIAPPPSDCSIDLGISGFNNESCAGNDGTFTLSSANAQQPITYNFGSGATQDPIFSNLNAGTYTVTATDAAGCDANLTVIISQDPTPSLSIINTDNENCGAANGSFTVEATGGRAPYIYELDNGQISRSPSFNNLAAGNYTISVMDANNCSASQAITIQRTGNINVSVADMRDDNCNGANGSFRIAATGGKTPYTYDLGNGAVTSNEFTGLTAGNYAVTVVDANDCSTVANININGSSAPVTAINNVTQTTCSQSTGSVNISVTGGAAPFQYNIGTGNITTPNFSNLAAGNYVITVTDANNCTATQAITINEPSSPAFSIVSSQDAACGNANGALSVISAGGQAPYTYDIGQGITTNPNFTSLAEGNYTVTVYDANNCTDVMAVTISNSPTPTVAIANKQDASCDLSNAILTVTGTGVAPFMYDLGTGPTSNPIFNNLAAGTYTVTLTDNNNCTASTTIEIESTGGPQINVQNTSEARCDRANGSFTVSAFGGFAPYTYDIGDGPTDDPEFYDLSGGNYVVTLTDDNGCTATQSITLGNIPAPTFGIGDIIDASCGEANGGFKVSAFGGLPPYKFSIGGEATSNPDFSELKAGAYTIRVTDANNCATALSVVIEGTAIPAIEVVNQQAASCSTSDGQFDLQVTGGVAPYFFDFGEGESTNNTFRNLSAGSYDITITDASNCSQIKTIEVAGSSEINLVINDQLPAACGADNGSFTLNPTGGQGPYNYTLNGIAYPSASFTDLAAGVYEVSAIDANGCSIGQTIEITATDGPSLAVEVLTNCGDASATIDVIATQGQAPYQYDIGDGLTSLSTFRNITEGTYALKVIDAAGCEQTQNVIVNINNQEPSASIDITQEPGCNSANGQIKVNVTRGVPPYLYALDDTQKSPFATFSNLGAGDYNITVTDAGGCSTIVPITLGAGENNPIANFDLNFQDLAGTFTNTTQNGTTYSWDFGDGNSTNTNDATHNFTTEGTYTICLTATNDCGADTYCEAYTIQALNTNKSFEFDFGEVTGTAGSTIKIPVYVLNFKSIVGFQKSVHLEDPSVAKIIGITDLNLKDLSTGLFSLKEDQFTMSWFDGAIAGLNLPDSTIIYQIEVELLSDNVCTGILIKEEPLPTEVYKKVGASEVEVDAFKRTGEICIGNGGVSNQVAKISGSITMEDGMNISAVNMSCTSQADKMNEEDGRYAFEALAIGDTYTITPNKNTNPLNGVTTFDLVLIQNHILGNQKFDSPYTIIAADVNKTGTITVSDILELRKLLLSDLTDFTKNTAWRFIPAAYEFPNPANPFETEFPESVTLNLKDKNLTADFIGVKIGDVNITATPNNLILADSRNTKTGVFTIIAEDTYLQKGESTTVTFKGEKLADLLGFQYTLKADNQALSIENIETHASFGKSNIGQSLKNKGYLLTSWVNEQPEKSVINKELFTLKVKAHQAGNLSDLLKINSDFLVAEAYDKAANHLNIELVFTTTTKAIKADFKLSQNQPNPFAQTTVIKYQLPDNGQVQFNIFDIQGSLLKSTEENGQKGWNELTIQGSDLPAGGVYYYQLSTPYGVAMKKLLLIDK